MNNEILKNNIRRYFLISIEKLLVANKPKLLEIEKQQNLIKNDIIGLKSFGLEYSEKIEELNNKYKELELMKPTIDWTKLGDKCLIDYSTKYNTIERSEISKIINKLIYSFRQITFTLATFKSYKKVRNKNYYEKHKKEDTMTLKENALNTAMKRRTKSLKVFNEVIEILKAKEMKITSTNIYEIIKNDFNDCLKIRQIKTYLKEWKAQNL